jgi:hypothetical protein
MDDSLFSILYRRLSERKTSLSEHLMAGGASTYEAYVRATAQYEAYTIIEEELKELEKRFMER